jgi:hypothetical protein
MFHIIKFVKSRLTRLKGTKEIKYSQADYSSIWPNWKEKHLNSNFDNQIVKPQLVRLTMT